MELYLQYGYGMKLTCLELLKSWGRGTVILSPRDISKVSIQKTGHELANAGASLLFDPQFYLPHADHETLCEYDYWPSDYETGGFWTGKGLERLLTDILTINQNLNCKSIILPSVHTQEVDDYWTECQMEVITAARELEPNTELICTISLGAEVLTDEHQVQELLETSRTWNVTSVYLVAEHPKGEYLVSDPSWLANVLDLVAGFRLAGRKVILGYSNHQMLITACAGASAIASGTWLNVRSFPPEKFNINIDEQVKTTTNWYYCPQALSEYKIQFLDVAARQGVLDVMKPDSIYGDSLKALFAGDPKPSLIGLKQRESFVHYLNCLKTQASLATLNSYEQTIDAHQKLLNSAEEILDILHQLGVRGQKRDFSENIDINRAALSIFESASGAMIRRHWTELHK